MTTAVAGTGSNASSNCFTTGDAKTTIAVFSTFGAIAFLFYIATILLIFTSRLYRVFAHRLTLYLAIGGLLRAVTLWLTVVPLDIQLPENHSASLRDGSGWESLCVLGGFLTQYSVFLQTFTVVWICAYVFVAVVLQKQLQALKHEIIGLVTVLSAPLMFTWEPFVTNSYGLTGTRCWIKNSVCDSYDSRALIYGLVIHVVPHLLLTLTGLVLLITAIISLARKVSVKSPKPIDRLYCVTMKGILPLMVYPLFYSLIYLMSVISLIWKTNHHFLNVTGTVVFVSLIQMCSCLLLLSLVLGPRFRGNLCLRARSVKDELPTSFESHNNTIP